MSFICLTYRPGRAFTNCVILKCIQINVNSTINVFPDFGMKDGSAHRLCLNLVYSQYEVLVDGTMVLAGNTFSRDTRGLVLEGVITLGMY